jgi:hypothetical protein
VIVRLAGDEVVSAGRVVRLPDAWTRRDADRRSRLALAAGVGSIAVLIGLVALVVAGRAGRRCCPRR